jgi:integrase
MSKSSESAVTGKPAKPYENFPLFPHATGRWAKKVAGKMCYFGPWADPDAALKKWHEQEHELRAGRKPRPQRVGLLIGDPPNDPDSAVGLVNRFLSAKRHLVDTREISLRTFKDYEATCQRLVDVFGWSRLVEDLEPEDFDRLRGELSKTRGPVALGNEIGRVRVVFGHAYHEKKGIRLISRPVHFGNSLSKPSKKTIRKSRAKRGTQVFESAEIRRMIDTASQPLLSMILLGINCALGQSDITSLPIDALDLTAGWLNYPRPKTGIDRKAKLWPETIKALKVALADRPRPTDPDDQGLAFITKYGARWSRTTEGGTNIDAISQEFRKLLAELKIGGKRGFYCLRRTFETIGGDSLDQVSVDFVMGHAPESDDMGAVYRGKIRDDRLKTVAEYVRVWLYPGKRKPR